MWSLFAFQALAFCSKKPTRCKLTYFNNMLIYFSTQVLAGGMFPQAQPQLLFSLTGTDKGVHHVQRD